MAVYERTYRAWSGERTPERWRFLVLPRYAYRQVFRSRLFSGFLVLCFVPTLVLAMRIYLPYNLGLLKSLGAEAQGFRTFLDVDAETFLKYMVWQAVVAFLVTFIIGPALISTDLRNNGLPLYLSRPFSRVEYILGKSAVLLILLSAVTWVPGWLLFGLKAYLAGWSWFRDNARIAAAIFFGAWTWIVVLCLLTLALSAYLKWKPLAQAALFGVFFVAMANGGLINVLFHTSWGSLINLLDLLQVVWAGLFGVERQVDIPVWCAWASLLAVCAGCLLLLARKLRAYEVVRG
ncbi:MAG TPA: hypothetical protein VJS92_09115 [Candidatus Polarisedimenticolaceae bacterium]|nr:hypothetical protein [Candidatus Polarisedimenticolaceae bacterium]